MFYDLESYYLKKAAKTLLIIFILGCILFPVFNSQEQLFHSIYANKRKSTKVISSDQLVKVDISVTAPSGHEFQGSTPLILKLSDIAASFPVTIDAFSLITSETSDDIKWDTTYVFHEGSLIHSQVDDIDDIAGFSEGDELVFALPKTINLAGGESTTFSVFLGLNPTNLSALIFPKVCTLSVYPNIAEINTEWPDMLGAEDGVYYIGNGELRAAIIRAAAWSSGGLYHIQLLDNEGNSRWDSVKQKFPYPSEIWKWSRFTVIEHFISQNQYPNTYPGIATKMITGPVRARMSVQSTQPYTIDGSNMINDLFGLFTFDIYADQTFLDYTLDITGSNAPNYSELVLELQNREWGGGRPGTLYTGIFIPGTGWVERSPDNASIMKVRSGGFASSWYLEALLEGTEVRPPSWYEPNEDPFRGFGFIFDDSGFANITWDANSESLSSWYTAAQFPLKARYHPFDKVTLDGQDKVAYMEKKYEEWSRPDLEFDFTSALVLIEEIPEFTYQPGITSQTTAITSQTTNVSSETSSKTSQIGISSITTFAVYPMIFMICLIAVAQRNKRN